MTALILIAIEVLGAVVIAWQAIERFNRMGASCRLAIVGAWLGLAAAAAAILEAALRGLLVPDWRSALLVGAVAVVALADRRQPK